MTTKCAEYVSAPAQSGHDALVESVVRAVDAALTGHPAGTRHQALGVIRRFCSTATEPLWPDAIQARKSEERVQSIKDALAEGFAQQKKGPPVSSAEERRVHAAVAARFEAILFPGRSPWHSTPDGLIGEVATRVADARKLRAEVGALAQQLTDILYPGSSKPDLSLQELMAEVARLRENAGRYVLSEDRDAVEQQVRDSTRAEVAGHLSSVLYPGDAANPGAERETRPLALEAVLAEVERRLRNSPGSTADEWEAAYRYLGEMGVPSTDANGADVPLVERVRQLLARERDAALEEAALAALCGIHGTTDPERHKAARDIRALKSQSALEGAAVKSVHQRLRSVSEQGVPSRTSDDTADVPLVERIRQLLVRERDAVLEEVAVETEQHAATQDWCSKTTGFEENRAKYTARGEALKDWARDVRAMKSKPASETPTEPIHNFGWALAQMRAGKKVRKPSMILPRFIYLDTSDGEQILMAGGATLGMVTQDYLLATDWEVVE
ncbi:DUF2829 domain-containing protein [Corallococcus sp. EGB]|uniref:DUF2829 domain-containing protein n=1 Tax=Corallococcus sp. EGB TaxID=1521117 RepID=UPI001CBC9F7D|nr:DUF2829 domain-containing protein [Corallococcus sp. EGB]